MDGGGFIVGKVWCEATREQFDCALKYAVKHSSQTSPRRIEADDQLPAGEATYWSPDFTFRRLAACRVQTDAGPRYYLAPWVPSLSQAEWDHRQTAAFQSVVDDEIGRYRARVADLVAQGVPLEVAKIRARRALPEWTGPRQDREAFERNPYDRNNPHGEFY